MSTTPIQTIPADYEVPLDLLNGRVVLITGAADGIGRALAISAAGHGATVVLLDRNVRKLEAVYDVIENNGGPQPAIYPMNLEAATPENYAELARTLEKNFGQLDGLVHNAATLGRPAPIELADIGAWFATLQINLNAPFLLTKACLPLMRQGKDGSIVFVSDRVGRQGKAYQNAYGVSKFALEGLMQILAEELADAGKIRVNSVDPGIVRTQLRRAAYPGEDADKLPAAEQIVDALVYLLGQESRELHGQTLRIELPTRQVNEP